MYYYIFEQPKTGSLASTQKKIKNLLVYYGIVGEIARVSPARNIEELAEIALAKQYNTIVVVGSDYLINQIVSYLQDRNCTLGIIPINTSPLVNKLIGVDNLKRACLSLKERKVKIIDLAYILPNKYFLTQATLSNSKPTLGTIYFDHCHSNIRFTNISIYSPSIVDTVSESKIYLNIINQEEGPNTLVKTVNWLFGKRIENNYKSYLRTKHLIIDTPEPIPVVIDNKIVAKTPVEIKIKPKTLKIITSRAKISLNNK